MDFVSFFQRLSTPCLLPGDRKQNMEANVLLVSDWEFLEVKMSRKKKKSLCNAMQSRLESRRTNVCGFSQYDLHFVINEGIAVNVKVGSES